MANLPLPIKRYILLDAFRGLAILWIVCFHVLVNVREQYGNVMCFIIKNGHLGVQVFFVISGYGVATLIPHCQNQKPLDFLLQRLRRIYVPYWWHLTFAALIIPTVSAMVSMIKTHAFNIEFAKYSITEWLEIVTLTKVFTSTSWKLNNSFLPLNGVIWYIAIIVQIYVFIFICLHFRKHLSKILFIAFLVSLFAHIPAVNELIPYGVFIPYFSQFYVGTVVYYMLHNIGVITGTVHRVLVVLLCASIAYFCAYSYNGLLPLSFSVFVGSIFIVLHKYDQRLSASIVARLLLLIGTFSYSLYLLHVPLWPFVGMFTRNIVPLPSSLSAPLVLVPGIIILSFIWYLFFEEPQSLQKIVNNMSAPIRTIWSGIIHVLAITNLRRI